jgi:hypothetical protein
MDISEFIKAHNLEHTDSLVVALNELVFDAKKRVYDTSGILHENLTDGDCIDREYDQSHRLARHAIHPKILEYCAKNDMRPHDLTPTYVLDNIVPQESWDYLIMIPKPELYQYLSSAITRSISGYVTYMKEHMEEHLATPTVVNEVQYEEVETPIEEIVEEDHTIGLAVLYALLLFVVFWIVLDFHFVISVFCSIVLPYVITQWNKP